MRMMTYAEGTYPHVMVNISTTPLDLMILLHDGAIESLRKAVLYMNSGDITGKTEHISKAIAIIERILTSFDLREGGDEAFYLQRVYAYILKELAIGHINNNVRIIGYIQDMMKELKKVWRQIQ